MQSSIFVLVQFPKFKDDIFENLQNSLTLFFVLYRFQTMGYLNITEQTVTEEQIRNKHE